MDKKLFADLVESMQQHNEIIAGARKAARVTKVDARSIKVLQCSKDPLRGNLQESGYSPRDDYISRETTLFPGLCA
jgi:hypothetical protein